jgi:hypothetical protein
MSVHEFGIIIVPIGPLHLTASFEMSLLDKPRVIRFIFLFELFFTKEVTLISSGPGDNTERDS